MPQKTQFEQLWLPLFPLASDDLMQGIYRMGRKDALERRYVEANPYAVANLLIVDCDQSDAHLRAISCVDSHPLPNAIVENPVNGHAHAVWALHEPVTRTEYARRKPLAFAAAITEGLRRSLDGDAGYSGLMTKNPVHDAWRTEWWTDHLYSLGEIEEHLGKNMPAVGWQRTRRKNPVGLGRNCSLFETARTWAYRQVRNHFGDSEGLLRAIAVECHTRNAEFSEPLQLREAEQIATSIHRWITTKSRMWTDGAVVYAATFSTIQSARGRKRVETRRQATLEALDRMRAL